MPWINVTGWTHLMDSLASTDMFNANDNMKM